MNAPSSSPHLYRFSLLVAAATLFLIFVGGLVTSTDSGLAVPDWPLSYGRLMPPMIGGIFYEHGHRMVATGIGFLTILLAVFFQFKEKRGWVKKAAWAALGLVIFQGLLGGLTVLLRLPRAISILHACTAQTFLCLVVALAVWTSSFWEKTQPAPANEPVKTPFHHITTALFWVAYLQLILGAVLRHTGWGLNLHIIGAFIVVGLSVWCWNRSRQQKFLTGLCSVVLGLVIAQVALGLTSYFLLGHEFDVIPMPFYATLTITFHVVTGAAILGLSAAVALAAQRARPLQPTRPLKTKLSDYFQLTKPGITFTAGITALAAFVLGSGGDVDFLKLIHTGIGTLLISAGACTLNMLIERDVDARMKRTRKRPLPSGRLNPGEALLLGTFLSVVALVYLGWAVNLLTALLAGLTLCVYLYVYTPLKKVTALCTTVGAVAGALPTLMGWSAATGQVGWPALALFGILFFWQFPHFFSLAWLYKDDYSQAGLHMLPRLEDNGTFTAVSICLNSLALLLVSVVPTAAGLTGIFYLGTALVLGVWIAGASFLFLKERSVRKARQLFFASLVYVPVLVIAMVLNHT